MRDNEGYCRDSDGTLVIVAAQSLSYQHQMASSAMEQGSLSSSYHSVIPENGAQWDRLNENTEALAQLHRKFWGGEAMQDEETRWRETQPENESMDVDVDETAEEDEDDEIGAGGCYTLTLDMPGIGRSPLWIRKEYIRIYDFCERHLASHRRGPEPPSVVITGQPGIGKCLASNS